MSTNDEFILFWLLPSLFTMLGLMQIVRKADGITPQRYDGEDWWAAVAVSVFYPIIWAMALWRVALLIGCLIKKERSFKRGEK